MPLLSLRFYGDPILAQKAQPIPTIEPRHHQLAADMIETMYKENGIGLAANQIGSLERIFVIDPGVKKSPNTHTPQVFINPEILKFSVEDEPYNEGCLSIPEIESEVYRPSRITVRWTDLEGNTHTQEFSDLAARVIQHELDHLDGILFIDQIPEKARVKLAGRLNKLKQDKGL